MRQLTSFSSEVASQLGHYVYRLVDPRDGVTFYVGKGQGNRVFDHKVGMAVLPEEADVPQALLSEKMRRLNEIQAADLALVRIIHRHGLSKSVAFEVEAALIDAYPRLANLQAGYDASRGLRSAQEISIFYGAKEFATGGHPLLMVSIAKTFPGRNVYDAARFAWRLNVNRACKAKYVLAHVRGLVIGVYKPTEWLSAIPENFPEFPEADVETKRFGFRGTQADAAVNKMYLNKRLPKNYKQKGAMSPVRYIDC